MSLLIPQLSPRAQFIFETVRDACEMASCWGLENEAFPKSDRSLVTPLDFAVQALVSNRLEERFPEELLVAEENGEMLEAHPEILQDMRRILDGRVSDSSDARLKELVARGEVVKAETGFYLDPIDSTLGLVGGHTFATNFAFIEKGVVQAAAIGAMRSDFSGPFYGIRHFIVVAEQGKGTFAISLDGRKERKLSVSTHDTLDGSILLSAYRGDIRRPDPFATIDPIQHRLWQNDIRLSAALQRAGTQSHLLMQRILRATLLAGGLGELHYVPAESLCSWDYAASVLLVEEAGGRVTDLVGDPIRFHGARFNMDDGILFSNGKVHDAFLELRRRCLAEE